jgi:hypothetical protein
MLFTSNLSQSVEVSGVPSKDIPDMDRFTISAWVNPTAETTGTTGGVPILTKDGTFTFGLKNGSPYLGLPNLTLNPSGELLEFDFNEVEDGDVTDNKLPINWYNTIRPISYDNTTPSFSNTVKYVKKSSELFSKTVGDLTWNGVEDKQFIHMNDYNFKDLYITHEWINKDKDFTIVIHYLLSRSGNPDRDTHSLCLFTNYPSSYTSFNFTTLQRNHITFVGTRYNTHPKGKVTYYNGTEYKNTDYTIDRTIPSHPGNKGEVFGNNNAYYGNYKIALVKEGNVFKFYETVGGDATTGIETVSDPNIVLDLSLFNYINNNHTPTNSVFITRFLQSAAIGKISLANYAMNNKQISDVTFSTST